QVDDEPAGPRPEQAKKLLTQHRSAGDVQLATERRDDVAICGPRREPEPPNRWESTVVEHHHAWPCLSRSRPEPVSCAPKATPTMLSTHTKSSVPRRYHAAAARRLSETSPSMARRCSACALPFRPHEPGPPADPSTPGEWCTPPSGSLLVFGSRPCRSPSDARTRWHHRRQGL